MPPPDGRFLVAFDDPALEWAPTWTRLDSHDSLVTRYSIDRGRQYELDRTDTGRATVEIADTDGTLDPSNPSGPYYGKLEPLLQAMIGRYNPMNDTWYTRFRGWIEDYDYSYHPSQRVDMLTISLVDIFEILAAIEMQPGQFGTAPPAESNAEIFFEDHNMDDRILSVLGPTGADIPADFYVVFSGNVGLWETAYSAGENVMTVIQESADSEFPGVSNVYCDRLGRLAVHGRFAKFDPVGVASGVTTDVWEYVAWRAGDLASMNADPPMAHIRRFGYNRGLSKIINTAHAYPMWTGADAHQPTTAELEGQLYQDATSVGLYGIRSWSAQALQTKESLVVGVDPDSLAETARFAAYYVENYKQPRPRVTEIAFRTARPGMSGAGETWDLLSRIDISHKLEITLASAAGAGFAGEEFFVEGVHEQVEPLNADYDDVTLTLDLSPAAYFTDLSMFPEVTP